VSASLQHETVLLDEAVAALNIRADGIYVDATFGRGGHSRKILAALGETGRLWAFDKDPAAITAGQTWVDARFGLIHSGFVHLADQLAERGVHQVDGVLMDLGVSSPQLDDAERGFSFRFDAPLDMRMDTTQGKSAADWLAEADEADIRGVI
jgi:16S rRNA (cytosine1402-N4)-methyltransferase